MKGRQKIRVRKVQSWRKKIWYKSLVKVQTQTEIGLFSPHTPVKQRQEKQWAEESGSERNWEIESKGWSAPSPTLMT